MNANAHHIPLHTYTTASYACSYLPQQTARSEVAFPNHLIDHSVYSQLVRIGFRRSGDFFYRPACHHCNACLSLRIPVNTFTPNRSQQRAWQKHRHLEARHLELQYHTEHYQLYRDYQHARHKHSGMDGDSAEQYSQFLLQSQVVSRLVEFRTPSQTTSPLRMVSLVDMLDDGISAVYTFYTPERKSSYGTYSILWLIEWARRLGLAYVYLGYWIPDSTKMAYKQKFLPHEFLQQNTWHSVTRSKPNKRDTEG